MLRKPRILATLVGLAVCGAVAASGPPEPGPALERMLGSGASVERSFEVSEHLTGWVVRFQGERKVVYTTNDGEHLVVGAVLDRDGENLTRSHVIGHAPEVLDRTRRIEPVTPSLWDDLGRSHHFQTGEGGPIVYAFYEPYCGACSAMVERYGRRDDVVIRWIPVSFMSDRSSAVAAALMSAGASAQAVLLEWNELKRKGAAAFFAKHPVGDDHLARTEAQLKANKALMARVGVTGTPALFVRKPNGEVVVHRGMPPPEAFQLMVAGR